MTLSHGEQAVLGYHGPLDTDAVLKIVTSDALQKYFEYQTYGAFVLLGPPIRLCVGTPVRPTLCLCVGTPIRPTLCLCVGTPIRPSLCLCVGTPHTPTAVPYHAPTVM